MKRTNRENKLSQDERDRHRPRYYDFHPGRFLLFFFGVLILVLFSHSYFQREHLRSIRSFCTKESSRQYAGVGWLAELTQNRYRFFGMSSHNADRCGTHILFCLLPRAYVTEFPFEFVSANHSPSVDCCWYILFLAMAFCLLLSWLGFWVTFCHIYIVSSLLFL